MQFQQGKGRRKQYCSQACRQRAYEHRSGRIQPTKSGSDPALPGSITLGPKAASNLKDLVFQLRCGVEDIRTAVDDGTDSVEIRHLADEALDIARRIEKIRALGPSEL